MLKNSTQLNETEILDKANEISKKLINEKVNEIKSNIETSMNQIEGIVSNISIAEKDRIDIRRQGDQDCNLSLKCSYVIKEVWFILYYTNK